MLKERKLNLLAIKLSGLRSEVNRAQRFPIPASPAAVKPGTHDQAVEGARCALFHRAKRGQGSKQILGVKPAAHCQYGWMNIFQILPDIALFPKMVIRGMLPEIVPERHRALQHRFVDVG